MEYLNKLYSGRLNRRTFVVAFFGVLIVYSILAGIIFGALGLTTGYSMYGSGGFNIVSTLVGLLFSLFFMSIPAKRFHDLGYSGWFALAFLALSAVGGFIPGLSTVLGLLSIVVFLYLALAPGKAGSNQFGAQPGDKFEFGKIYQYK